MKIYLSSRSVCGLLFGTIGAFIAASYLSAKNNADHLASPAAVGVPLIFIFPFLGLFLSFIFALFIFVIVDYFSKKKTLISHKINDAALIAIAVDVIVSIIMWNMPYEFRLFYMW